MNRWALSRNLITSIALLTLGVAPQLKLHSFMTGPVTTPPQAIEQGYAQQLQAAQQEASRNRLPLAIERIAGIPRNSQHFDQASRFQEDWSKELLRQATAQYRQGDVQAAQATIAAIPNTGSIAPQLQARQQQWANEAEQLAQVTAAQSSQDWDSALEALDALRGSELYNTPQVQALVAQTLDRAANPTVTITSTTTAAMPTASATVTPITFTADVDAPKLDIAPPKPATLAVDVDAALETSRPIERLVSDRPAPLPQAALATSGKPVTMTAIEPAQPEVMPIATAETAGTVSLPKPIPVAARPAPVPNRSPLSTALLVKPTAQQSEAKPTVVAAMALSENSSVQSIEISTPTTEPASTEPLPTVSSDAMESIDPKTPNLGPVETGSEAALPVVELETLLPTEASLPELPPIEVIPLTVSDLQPQTVSTLEIDAAAIEAKPVQPSGEQPVVKQGEMGLELKPQELPVPAQI